MTQTAPSAAPRRYARAAAVVATAVVAVSCGAPLMKLPAASAGAPAADARPAFEQATAACRAVSSFSAEVAVKGSIGGRRIRARLLTGLATPASVRLEAFASSQPIFFFVASGRDATLVLPPPEDRVLRGAPPDQVLEAVTGLRVTPEDLRATLTGCVPDNAVGDARALGDDWRMLPGETAAYLHRDGARAPWRVVAAIRHDSTGAAWRAEYGDFVNGLPTSIRLTSSVERRFDLQLALSQIDTAAALDEAAFRLQVAPTARPITLVELRDAGPLGTPAK